MKSSQLITAVSLAIVAGVVGYLVSSPLNLDGNTIAISAALGALFANVAAVLLTSDGAQEGNDEIKTL